MGVRPGIPWVLLVEDDVSLAASLRRLLEGEAAVSAVFDDESARIRMLEEDFDWVLFDMSLGVDAGRKLHAYVTERRPELAEKIIVIAGGDCSDVDRAFLASLGRRALRRPFSLDALRELLGLPLR